MKIVGYCDRLSVQPGETLRFMVSCELPSYQADIVRLVHGDENPKGPGFKEELVETPATGEYQGRKQEIHTGSYGTVPDHPLLRCTDGFTLQAWVYPTTPQKGVQGILTKWWHPERVGYGLFMDEDGSLALWVGDGNGRVEKLRAGAPMRGSEWYFVAGAYDSATGHAQLYQEPLSQWPVEDSRAVVDSSLQTGGVGDGDAKVVMAGYRDWEEPGEAGVVAHFNGKIDRPRVYGRALEPEHIDSLRRGAPPANVAEGLIAAWDYSADISSRRITDTSPHRLHGEVVNMPTRAVTGHNWRGDQVDFKGAPEEYGAIHFHDDDLEDAGWEVDFELAVPDGLRSGAYAARLRSGDDEDYVPFFVRPRKGTASARIAFLAPTFSYLAYADEQMMKTLGPQVIRGAQPDTYPSQPQDKYVLEKGLKSLYDLHSDGSGVCYASRMRPIVNMRPKYNMPTSIARGMPSPHQFSADLHLLDWMEAKGHEYDVVTDEDLHFEGPDLLAPYKVIVTGSHPEYWTAQMLEDMDAYLARGGRLMYLGGNGFYWVTSVDPERPHIIELRRWGGSGNWKAGPGEYYHSTTGELGGVWRNRNREPQKMLGVGFTAQGAGRNAPYRRQPGSHDPRAAFIFEGVGEDELIGDIPSLVREHGAAGFELDRLDYDLGTPPHALLLASSFGHPDTYHHVIEEEKASGLLTGGTVNPFVRADLVYFEGPKGGAVFSVGSISWCGSLSYNSYDNNVSRVTDNVLTRFASDEPLP